MLSLITFRDFFFVIDAKLGLITYCHAFFYLSHDGFLVKKFLHVEKYCLLHSI